MKENRRSFLAKLGLGAFSLVLWPFQSKAKENTKRLKYDLEHMDYIDTDKPIYRIKPMGFMWDTLDPFLFCVHHEDKFPKGNAQMEPDPKHLEGRHIGDDFIIKDGWRMYHGDKIPGFPGHPHRGFETITVVREGIVDHADSLGASGRYGEGDVQWMTAGKGVQHSEMFPLIHADKDNHMELFQIWLNLPKKNKFVEPHFKMLWGSKIPKYTHKDKVGKQTYAEVIAGSLFGYKAPTPPPNSWAANPANEVAIYNLKMEAGATFVLPKAAAGVNRVLYFYKGQDIKMAGVDIKSYHSVVVNPEMDLIIQNGSIESKILVLQGQPIKEQVIQYGPFVMNTKEEINQAFEDYHKTQFGGWPWKRGDQVHDRNAGRFAKHADGTFEKGV